MCRKLISQMDEKVTEDLFTEFSNTGGLRQIFSARKNFFLLQSRDASVVVADSNHLRSYKRFQPAKHRKPAGYHLAFKLAWKQASKRSFPHCPPTEHCCVCFF